MEKDLISIDPSRKHSVCIVCMSEIDVKSFSFGRLRNNRSGFDLCKACRSLLHKRLHEENEKL